MERPKARALHNDMVYSLHLECTSSHQTVTYDIYVKILMLIDREGLTNRIHVDYALESQNERFPGSLEVQYKDTSRNLLFHHDNITPKLCLILRNNEMCFQRPSRSTSPRGTSYIMTKGLCRLSSKDVFRNTTYCCLPNCKPAVNRRKGDSSLGYPLVFAMIAVIGRIASSFEDNTPCAISRPSDMPEEDFTNFYYPERMSCRREMYKDLLSEVWNSTPPREFQALVSSVGFSFGIRDIDTTTYESCIEELLLYLPENMALRWISNVLRHCDKRNCPILTRTLGYLFKFYPAELPKSSKIRLAMDIDSEIQKNKICVSVGNVETEVAEVPLAHQYVLLAGYLRECVHKHCLNYTNMQCEIVRRREMNDHCIILIFEVFVFFKGKSLDYNVIVRDEKPLNEKFDRRMLFLPPTLDPMVSEFISSSHSLSLMYINIYPCQ